MEIYSWLMIIMIKVRHFRWRLRMTIRCMCWLSHFCLTTQRGYSKGLRMSCGETLMRKEATSWRSKMEWLARWMNNRDSPDNSQTRLFVEKNEDREHSSWLGDGFRLLRDGHAVLWGLVEIDRRLGLPQGHDPALGTRVSVPDQCAGRPEVRFRQGSRGVCRILHGYGCGKFQLRLRLHNRSWKQNVHVSLGLFEPENALSGYLAILLQEKYSSAGWGPLLQTGLQIPWPLWVLGIPSSYIDHWHEMDLEIFIQYF